jgi:glycosyltransferase involved in cell wall biosynthesis
MTHALANEPCHVMPSMPQDAAAAAIVPNSEVWMLGPLPPPVTGMTLLTRAVLAAMQQAGPVRFLNWSPNMMRRSLRMRLKRNWQVLKSIAALWRHGRVNGQRLYIVANSPAGLYLTALLVYLGRRRGYTVYLHHHVYTYIDRYDRRMAWIDRSLAGRGFHVVHAQKMIDDFRRQYHSRNEFVVVHPSIIGVPIGRPRESSNKPFRLGLLSALQASKGFDIAIDTFKSLRDAGMEVTLTLAGPVASSKDRRMIHETITSYPNRVRYLGPVYDSEKKKFFDEIDAFIFPTMTESWGLVLNEALGSGIPVITFDRGCTATVVGAEAGLLIDPTSSFVSAASQQVALWMENDNDYRGASRAAVAQAEHLRREGQLTLAAFVRHMFHDALPPKG